MVACTLDYNWGYYVLAALVTLLVGVVILAPVKLWQVLERRIRRRQQRRPTTATGCRSCLGRLRTAAEGIIAGNSTVNKIMVSQFSSKSTLIHQ